jgi:glycosyltransferase involved in cell wall biosynthesis
VKILMIAPTPFFSHRGTHIRILEEARALERLGHKIMIVTYHNGDDITDFIDTNIDVRRIRRWLFWYKKTEAGPDWQKVLLNIFLIVKSFNMIRSWKPDVVHSHLHEGILIGRLMQILFFGRKLPLVSDFHGSLVGEMRSHGYLGVPPIGTIFRSLEKWISSMGDVAVVSGEENVATIENARDDKKATYLWDGVNISDYDEDLDKFAMRKKYEIAKNKFVIVYTGAFIENKGINHILESIPFVIKKHEDVQFVLGGYPASWVKKYIKTRKLEKNVKVISPLNYFTLAQVNSVADIAIDPKDATVNQASGKLLQYMAAGVGIICVNRPTNHKYLSNSSAQFIDAVDASSLSVAIENFYNDRGLLDKCANGARLDVEKFDWNQIGKKLDDIYKQLVSSV